MTTPTITLSTAVTSAEWSDFAPYLAALIASFSLATGFAKSLAPNETGKTVSKWVEITANFGVAVFAYAAYYAWQLNREEGLTFAEVVMPVGVPIAAIALGVGAGTIIPRALNWQRERTEPRRIASTTESSPESPGQGQTRDEEGKEPADT